MIQIYTIYFIYLILLGIYFLKYVNKNDVGHFANSQIGKFSVLGSKIKPKKTPYLSIERSYFDQRLAYA